MSVLRLLYLLFVCLVVACSPDKIPVIVETANSTNTTILKDIVFINDSVGYAAGGQGYISGILMSTHDGGNSWQTDSIFIPGILSLNNFGDTMVIGVGYSGNLMINKYDKGWKGIRLYDWSEYKEVTVTHNNDMFIAVGSSFHGGKLVHVTADLYIDTIYDFDNEIKTVVSLNNNELVAAGYGVIIKSQDNGRSWKRSTQDGDYYQKLVFPNEKLGYAVGFAGSIIKTTDGGNNWVKLKNSKNHSFGSEPFLDMVCKDENNIYICGNNGTLWKSDDGGNNWQQFEEFTDDHLTGITTKGNNIWLSSSSGKIYRVTD